MKAQITSKITLYTTHYTHTTTLTFAYFTGYSYPSFHAVLMVMGMGIHVGCYREFEICSSTIRYCRGVKLTELERLQYFKIEILGTDGYGNNPVFNISTKKRVIRHFSMATLRLLVCAIKFIELIKAKRLTHPDLRPINGKMAECNPYLRLLRFDGNSPSSGTPDTRKRMRQTRIPVA
uniref:Uncharacterized protein n=1 Tax=Glossina pallidipes TaxID=7398 RepID=A0A1A9ZT44_GLOPL